jgi:hypothetical protein
VRGRVVQVLVYRVKAYPSARVTRAIAGLDSTNLGYWGVLPLTVNLVATKIKEGQRQAALR